MMFLASKDGEAEFKVGVGKARLLAVSKDVESGRALLDKVLATGTADDGAWYLDAELKAATGDLDAALRGAAHVEHRRFDHHLLEAPAPQRLH